MSSIMRKSVDNVNDGDSPSPPASSRRSKAGHRPAPSPGGNAAADAVLELVHTVMHQFRSLQYHALRGV